MYDFENKELTWKKLMEDISKRTNYELSQISLITIKPINNSKSNQKPLLTLNTQNTRNENKVFCNNCGFKHLSNK